MTTPAPARRIHSLDGLRGLAAVIVVVGHLIVASIPALAAVFYVAHPHLGSFDHLITYTPLHIFWAGQEWVIVFFVLSGFVLSLAASNGARFIGRSYYPNRFVRLYVPVWCALVVAAIAHVVVSHHAVPGATIWLNDHDSPLTLHRGIFDATLFYKAGDGAFSTVLWSLKWEVLFSLLLPAYLLVASFVNLWLVTAVSLTIVFLSFSASDPLHYLPTFMLGVVLAYGRRDIIKHLLSPTRAWTTLLASLCLLTADWWLPGGSSAWRGAGVALVAVGAMGIVACGMLGRYFATLLDTRPFQLVGKRSFSLYLVHEPIVVATAFALGGRPSVLLLAVIALPVAAVVTEGFYRSIERPSHRWAREVAAYVYGRARQVRT